MNKTLERKINSLRKRTVGNFFLFAALPRLFYCPEKPFEAYYNPEIPVYVVNSLYEMSSREWLLRLDVTIHAAVARSVQHGLID